MYESYTVIQNIFIYLQIRELQYCYIKPSFEVKR